MGIAWCIWITGLPGSGKSTISLSLSKKLKDLNIPTQIISVDMLRYYATPKPTYSEEEREIIYGSLVFTAKILTENNINVIIDATGNRRGFRLKAREAIPKFIEVYLECPIETCIKRESERKKTYLTPANIYKKAQEGKTFTVPGMGVPYEEPLKPEIRIHTVKFSIKESVKKILEFLQEKNFIP